jgi:DNA (cytosine-5)-methyltransferase 1
MKNVTGDFQNDNNTKTITHLSLCTGYEGIGLGLRRVLPNVREVAYVEREGFPVANLVAKMEAAELDAAPVFTDVKTFPYRKFRGCVDILSGGFPCQPFSNAGVRKGVDDPRHLFPFIRDGIRDCQPRIVFLENVEGIISSKTADGESVLQYVLRELEGLGYRATAGIFSASEVGAPHQRKRVFIFGLADSYRERRQRPVSLLGDSSQNRQGWENPAPHRIFGSDGIARPTNNSWPSRPEEAQKELADSSSERLQRKLFSSGVNSQRRKESDGRTSSSCGIRQNELADPDSSGGGEDRKPTELRSEGSVESPLNRWPSRPGEAQKEWEEPRLTQVEGQAQPRLGRAVDGTSSRVDRLRLLGNGVVPDTAAKAFVTLLKRLKPESSDL